MNFVDKTLECIERVIAGNEERGEMWAVLLLSRDTIELLRDQLKEASMRAQNYEQQAAEITNKGFEEMKKEEFDAMWEAAHKEYTQGLNTIKGLAAKNDPWKNRSAGMTCSTCMWFAEKIPNPDQPTSAEIRVEESFGRCRRHAPSMQGYPAVFGNDWCGDHKLDENKR